MKLKFYSIFILTVSVLLVNCTDSGCSLENNIKRTWRLTHISGGLAGVDLEYATVEVNWTFNSDGTVNIYNYTQANSQLNSFAGFSTGTYSYRVTTVNNIKELYINNEYQGEITIRNLQLLIDDGYASDGFLKTFNLLAEE